MRTHNIFRGLMALLFLTVVGQSLMAQEAFYVYRNDGEFNGFFFDQVKRMEYSKVDFDGVEHDEYVIQEIETEDSLYRIPLLAIDSIGFQQPEIILSRHFYDLSSEDCPYKNIGRGVEEREDGLFVLRWRPKFYDEELDAFLSLYENRERYLSYIPKVGDVLFDPGVNLSKGPFVGKVIEVDPETFYFYGNMDFIHIICAPIEDFSDVFEQFISVEQLTTDDSGKTRSRVAGLNTLKSRGFSGNKEMTLLDLSGSFPLKLASSGDFEATLNLNLALAIKANVAYNIQRGKDFHINMKLSEEGDVSASFTAKGTLEDVTTWHLAGTTVYFPTFLPILQLNPAPGAFLKTSGDMALTVSSPKLGFRAEQGISITSKGPRGSKDFKWVTPSDEDNNWGMELSLNGSAQAGTHIPFNIETNTWAKKIFWCSTGIDAYVGPKLSASFTLDPVALAKGDAYNTFANTRINFKPLAAVLEGTAKFSTGTRYEEEFKIFDAELGGAGVDLTMFPKFDQTETKHYEYTEGGFRYPNMLETTVYPRGNSVPFCIGAAIYSEKLPSTGKRVHVRTSYKDFIDKNYTINGGYERMYSFFNTYDKGRFFFNTDNLDGIYTVVPVIKVLGYDVPVWDAAVETKEFFAPVNLGSPENLNDPILEKNISINVSSGTITVGWLYDGDQVEFVLTDGSSWTYNRSTGITEAKIGSKVKFTEIAREEIQYQSMGGLKLYSATFRYDNSLVSQKTNDSSYEHYEKNTFEVKVSRNINGKKHERISNNKIYFSKKID